MASKLAQNVLRQGQKEAPRLFGGKARQFYWEVVNTIKLAIVYILTIFELYSAHVWCWVTS